ncbi:MAG: CdaR family protein [Candidatus Muirbacterium halophilum]|nr:CdaR family protein [Candidatus Muirbacterium halophilum]MCK9474626.1 CdaR family protein [Candidatus Muirbacterium halophilum]
MALDVTRDILTRNIGLKTIALLVSVMLWLYVISTDDPEVIREKNLKISVKGANERVVHELLKNEVKVTVKGKRKEIIRGIENIFAIVDLKGKEEIGQFDLPVILFKPDEIELIRIEPDKIPVILKNIFYTKMLVDYQIMKKNDFYYDYITDVPNEVEILGDKSDIDRIFTVKVKLNLVNYSEGEHSIRAKIDVLDRNYDKIKNLKINPPDVLVNISANKFPIEAKLIKADIGTVPEDYEIFSVFINPDTVDVKAHPEVLSEIEYIKTEPIILDERKNSITKNYRLIEGNDFSFVKRKDVEVTVVLKKKGE